MCPCVACPYIWSRLGASERSWEALNMPLISPTVEKRRSRAMSAVAAHLALIAGFLVFAPDVSANVLNSQDVDSIGVVLAKSARMHQDIANIGRVSSRSGSPTGQRQPRAPTPPPPACGRTQGC